MRRRLISLAIAITTMVALAFLVPLAFVVRDLAADRAVGAGERRAQDLARLIATTSTERGLSLALDEVLDPADAALPTSIVVAGDSVFGAPLLPGEDVSEALRGTALSARSGSGHLIYTPVIQSDGSTVVVRVLVPSSLIEQNVGRSWFILAGVGVALVGLGALAAGILGRSIVIPVEELARSAARLGSGELEVRVTPTGPPEVQVAAGELNRMADKVTLLLEQERETSANLSHRLRTPLTALRLDIEALDDSEAVQRVWDDIEILERTVDFVIQRSAGVVAPVGTSDLRAIVADRVEFWMPLAVERGRHLTFTAPTDPITIGLGEADCEAIVDVLFDNTFTHVGEAAPISVSLSVDDHVSELLFEDGGQGFPSSSVVERGVSGGSSTGLGLDIVRSAVQSAGGSMRIGASPSLGGALVAVRIPLVDQLTVAGA